MSLRGVKDKAEVEVSGKCEDVSHLIASAWVGSILMVSVPCSAHLPSTLDEFFVPQKRIIFILFSFYQNVCDLGT